MIILTNSIKRIIVVVLLTLSNTTFYCQNNLILNPSCEDLRHWIGGCDPWITGYNSGGSVYDYFGCVLNWWELGSCDHFSIVNPSYPTSPLSIPLSQFGYQMTQHGYDYVGLGVLNVSPTPPPPNNIYIGGNEHLGGYFEETLKVNVKYSFSFYVSLAEVSNAFSKSLQIKTFTDSVCNDFTECNLEGTTIWEIDTLISQKTDWHKINFTFTAQGNERAFLIGAFNPNNQLGFQYIPETDSGWNFDRSSQTLLTYWFLDNFSLTEIIDPVPFEDNLSITNNPGYGNATTQFKATLNTASTADLFVYDEAGRIIAHHVFTESQEIFSLPQLAGAVYYYTFDSDTHVRLEGKIVQY